MSNDDFSLFLQALNDRLQSLDEKMDSKFEKVGDKLDGIERRVDSIDTTLVKQAEQLEHHIKRTDLLEGMIKPVTTAWTVVRWGGLPLLVVAVVLFALLGVEVAPLLKLLLTLF